MGSQLHVLPLGECCCNYEVIAPGVEDGRRLHIPVLAYLIQLPEGSLALVDTGMSRVHVEDPSRTWRGHALEHALVPVMRPEDSLLFRLAELGVAPQEIDYVINTHLHFDHAGNNDLLAGATFFVQREQYDFAKGNPAFPNQYWNLPSLRYELVDGEAELFGNVRVVPTPGHAPGHQSVVVSLPESGAMLLCGDAVYTEENYTNDSWDSQADPARARESALALRDLAQHLPATMIYGHDRNQFKRLRLAPEAYR